MLEAFLDELAREYARVMPTEDVDARLAEAEAHLREGIEGRLELGLPSVEAEREAIEAFGTARRLAHAAASPARLADRARLRWLDAYWGLAAFAFAWSTLSHAPSSDVLAAVQVAALMTVAAGFGLSAFRTGRAASWSVIRRSAVALALGAAMMFAGCVVYETDGTPNSVPRFDALDRAAEKDAAAAEAAAGRLLVANQTKAETVALYRREATELRDAIAHPLSNILPTVSLVRMVGLPLAVPPLAFDLLFGSLGWLATRPRRRKGVA